MTAKSCTSRACVYCGGQGEITREHLFPSWLHDRIGPMALLNVKTPAEKMITGEVTIRDVCHGCNCGPISVLDTYVCSLYDNYFKNFVMPGECVNFRYDFDLLVRGLLKIGYNAARVSKWEINLSPYAGYIVGRDKRPARLQMLAQLVVPYPLKARDREWLGELSGHIDSFTPSLCAVIPLVSERLPGIEAGLVLAIRSYQFYVIAATEDSERSQVAGTVHDLQREVHGLTGISSLGQSQRLYASSENIKDIMCRYGAARLKGKTPSPLYQKVLAKWAANELFPTEE
jgi:hypothetical protein